MASLPSRMMGDFIYLGVFLFVVFVFVFGFLFICIFLFWSSCPFSKMKKILEMDAVCLWAHNNVNTFNAIELYIQKWLKWQISWHVQLTTIKNKGKFFLIKKYWCWLSQPQINIPSISPFSSLLYTVLLISSTTRAGVNKHLLQRTSEKIISAFGAIQSLLQQLCHYGREAATEDMKTNEQGCIPIKLYL